MGNLESCDRIVAALRFLGPVRVSSKDLATTSVVARSEELKAGDTITLGVRPHVLTPTEKRWRRRAG